MRPAHLEPTDDLAVAARQIFTDDGMNLGILYSGKRPPYQPPIGRAEATPEDLEAEFAL